MKAHPAALVACSLLLLGHGSPAQGVGGGTIVATGGSLQLTPITGEPYSATTETEVHQTLADGTHIDRKIQTTKQYRDSQGRTREEHYMGPLNSYIGGIPDGQAPTLVNVMIQDPVAGTVWFLSPQNHSARLTNLNSNLHNTRSQPVNTAPPPPMPRASLPKTIHEDLGTQTMEGLIVEGTRSTMTIPTGSQGNDRPIEVVTEAWRSNELHLVVLNTHSDPRIGEETTRLTNIDRSEPDLTLFQVPADYTITQQQ